MYDAGMEREVWADYNCATGGNTEDTEKAFERLKRVNPGLMNMSSVWICMSASQPPDWAAHPGDDPNNTFV
jgi:hypothetical protein